MKTLKGGVTQQISDTNSSSALSSLCCAKPKTLVRISVPAGLSSEITCYFSQRSKEGEVSALLRTGRQRWRRGEPRRPPTRRRSWHLVKSRLKQNNIPALWKKRQQNYLLRCCIQSVLFICRSLSAITDVRIMKDG